MAHGLKVYSDAGNVTVDGDYQMMSLLEAGSVVTGSGWTAITLANPIPVNDAPLVFARLSDQTKEFGPLFFTVSSGQVTGFTIPVNGSGITLYWRVYVRRSNAGLPAPSGYGLAVYDASGQVALDSSQDLGLIAYQSTLALPSPKTISTSSSLSHACADAFICLNPFKELFIVEAGVPGWVRIIALVCTVGDTSVNLLYRPILTAMDSAGAGPLAEIHDPIPVILMRSA